MACFFFSLLSLALFENSLRAEIGVTQNEGEKSWLDFQGSISFIYDSNLAESGASTEYELSDPIARGPRGEGGGPGGGSGRPSSQSPPALTSLGSSATVGGFGLGSALNLSKELIEGSGGREPRLEVGLDTFGSFYRQYSSYDYESYNPYLLFSRENGDFKPALRLSYLDTFYDWTRYQNYISLTPSGNWKLGKQWKLDVEFELIRETSRSKSWNYSPAATISFSWGEHSNVFLKESYLIADGVSAVIAQGTPPVIVEGALFSNYKTESIGFGSELELPAQWQLIVASSVAWTAYAQENIPAGGPPVGPNRADTLVSTTLGLEHGTAFEWLKYKFNVERYRNYSTGFAGGPLVSATSFPNYNYSRWVYMATLTANY